MIENIFKQNEGVLIKVIPNIENKNETVPQLISLIQDISDNKFEEILKHKKEFINFRNIKNNFIKIKNILTKHPNIISYEIYSDNKSTTFNFWVPKHISNMFIKQLYTIWQGGEILVLQKDYIDFDLDKTQFAQIRFGESSILPINGKVEFTKQLINYLDTIENDEKTAIQFVLKPADEHWNRGDKEVEKLIKNQNLPSKNLLLNLFAEAVNEISEIFFSGYDKKKAAKTLKTTKIYSKMSQKGLDITIRVAAQSDSKHRSDSIINGILGMLKIMERTDEPSNKFIRQDILLMGKNKEEFYKHMKERRSPIVKINSDIWVNDEVVGFLQLPDKSITSNKVEKITVRQTIVPESLKEQSKLRMGKHTINGKTEMLYWDLKDMDTVMRPAVIIANPGEGKSEMCKNKFLDWVKLGYGAAVIDVADGKLADSILMSLDEEDKHRVVLIDCNDLSYPPALSDFSEANSGERGLSQLLTQLWTEFYINFFGIDDHHRSKDFIRKSSVPIFSYEENTILEQYLMIKSDEFRSQFLEKIKNNRRLYKYWLWWTAFDKRPFKVKAEEVKAILNKFDVLMDNDILKNIICQRDSKIPKFRQLMDNRNIVIIKAGEGAIYYEASRIIGALTLMKFWMAALSRYSIPENKRVPFKLFCDEPQNYIASGDYVKEMLAKTRKYRLGLEFYFQDPVQIEEKDKNLIKLLVSMNPHLILGKMGANEYKKYFKGRISPIEPDEGALLPKYHWIVSIYRDKNPVPPFIMEAVDITPEPSNWIKHTRRQWIENLKLKYGAPVEQVEGDITARELIGIEMDFDDDNGSGVEISGNATSL